MKPHPYNLNRLGLPAAALLAAITQIAAAADFPTTVLSYNPVGYYRLSETAVVPAANTVANSGSTGVLGTG